ncbi:PKD domain-containing protein [Filimonas effusa]|nr:PKD domain-containing protein [Filimonas effusa]
MTRWKMMVAVLLIGACSTMESSAQSISNRGKDFWVSYPFNWFFENSNSQEMVLYFSAEEDAVVTLTSHLESGATWERIYNVAAGTVVSSDEIPKGGLNDSRLYDYAYPAGNGGQGLIKKAIHVHSTTPIVAYAHYMGNATSGAAMLLPVESWGQSYVTLNNKNYFGTQPSNTYFYISAAHDNTVVEITPKTSSRNERDFNGGASRAAGVPFTITLNKGQSYQFIGRNMADDLTGSRVKSIANSSGVCYPVAVYAGTSRTTLGCTGNGGSGDFIMQQCFPTQAWGSTFLTVPASNDAGANVLMTNIYRVLVKDPATVVKRNGVTLSSSTLVNGDYYQFNSGTPDFIEADKPIMVAQYFPSTGACPNSSGNGDPEMIYLSPREQAINRTGFYRNRLEAITTNYLTLVIPNKGTGLSSLKIDGVNVSSLALPATNLYIAPHPQNNDYSIVVRRWVSARAQCIVESDSSFTAITYGLGNVESYGYNAGTYINNLSAISAIHNTLDPANAMHEFTCINSPVKISALLRYQPTRLEWRLSPLASIMNPAADIVNNTPVADGTVVVKGEVRYKYTLSGDYLFNTPGVHEFSIFATHSSVETCDNTEEVKLSIEVKAKPEVDFIVNHPTGCSLDTVYLTGPDNSTENYRIRDWSWTFPAGASATGKDTLHVFGAGADQPIKLSVVTTDGCTSDTTKPITIYAPPVVSVSMSPADVCGGADVSFTPAVTYQGTSAVTGSYWDFGNGTILTPSNSDAQTVKYETGGSYTIRYAAKISETCVSDTLDKPVSIYNKPEVDITYPAGCLPADGVVDFVNNTSVSDAQTITSHQWNFGDGNATAANPNTSTQASPSHTYTAYGNYYVTYSAQTDKGCRVDTIIKAVFNLTPVLSYGSFSAVCADVAPFSVATASVTNGVPGSFEYSGAGTSSDGTFNPATAGPGTHTITATFTSDAKCVVIITSSVTVNAVPVTSFTIPVNGCLPSNGEVTFDNTSTISPAETLTWSWNFGDANATAGNENTSSLFEPSHKYKDGTYTISLTATSASGCAKETSVTAQLNVTPIVDYPALTAVCESAVPYSIAIATVNGAVVSGGSYSGKGLSVNGMFDPAAAGAGIHEVTYSYTTAGGCKEDASSSIEVYARPTAVFTIDKDPCSGEAIHVVPGAQTGTQTWSWKIGGNAVGTYANNNAFDIPALSAAGTYKVEVATTNPLGCTNEASENIIVHPLPTADFNVPVKICVPGSATFTNTSSVGDNAALSYEWTFSDAPSTIIRDKDPVRSYTSTTSHSAILKVTSAYGCQASSSAKTVSDFYPAPTADFMINPSEICQGADIAFADASTPSGSVTAWNWQFSDGVTSNSQSPVRKFDNAGTYSVSLTTGNAAGCYSVPVSKSVTVHLQPQIDAGRSFVALLGTSVQFEATANSSLLSFSWSPAVGLSNPNTLRPSLIVNTDATYVLTAVGEYNCAAKDSLTVKVLRTVVVPNAFSPNNDRVNDRWEIPNLSDYPNSVVSVFNRYGQKVFESRGYATSWDGRSSGKELPMGTYYYIINLGDGSKAMTGAVTIIR